MTFRRLVATCVGSVYLIAGLSVSDAVGAERAAKDNDAAQLRVGTFDSRAVAVAYAHSHLFANRLKSLRADYEKAKKAGDAERVKTLEAQGQAQQELLHKQGFSTWPVDNILEQMKSDIPKIAEQAGVDLIVSKWHVVFQRPGVECVDVTDLLVKPLQPDANTLKVIQDLRKHRPVSRAADENLPVGRASSLPFPANSQAGSLRHGTKPTAAPVPLEELKKHEH